MPSLGLALPFFAACAHKPTGGVEAIADRQATVASERAQIEAIPPPSKARFMAVRSFDTWQNPYITVQPSMLTLHILRADANPTDYGLGGMLRPVGARREDVTVSPDKLGEALATMPGSAWPYGRVVAVEEAHKTPLKQEPVVRRNMEATVAVLNDLGIVAYDLADGSVR